MKHRKIVNKAQLGSVAVDSETGVEDYSQPKQNQTSQPDQSSGDVAVPKEFLQLFEHNEGEQIYGQGLRHPVGILGIYALGLIGILLTFGLYAYILQDSSLAASLSMGSGDLRAVASFAVILLLGISIGITLLAVYVYRRSRFILTTQKVVLIQYHSLISREVSQINIGEVEDVNVSQPTIFDRIFKMGTVTIETAGEQDNYILTGIKEPYEFARKTVKLHEGSVEQHGN